jgi:hypothetical protein
MASVGQGQVPVTMSPGDGTIGLLSDRCTARSTVFPATVALFVRDSCYRQRGARVMATTLFKDTTYSVFGLIEDIKQGEVALPDIQRPFVWGTTKVRDLLDSMYKGFPVGYLLFWETGVEAGARQIGVNAKEKVPRLLIVDGQQRLTSPTPRT